MPFVTFGTVKNFILDLKFIDNGVQRFGKDFIGCSIVYNKMNYESRGFRQGRRVENQSWAHVSEHSLTK